MTHLGSLLVSSWTGNDTTKDGSNELVVERRRKRAAETIYKRNQSAVVYVSYLIWSDSN